LVKSGDERELHDLLQYAKTAYIREYVNNRINTKQNSDELKDELKNVQPTVVNKIK